MSTFHPDDIRHAAAAARAQAVPPPAALPLPVSVLCLHAGNLPLVGWQDVLAVYRAGMRYAGKLSRKDPDLIPAFLAETALPLAPVPGFPLHHTDLAAFRGLRADAVLFSGSESSVPGVLRRLHELDAVHDATRFLIRTAHTSLAWVDRLDTDTLRELAEGIARYDGAGCRSVRRIHSPLAFTQAARLLADAGSPFADRTPPPRIRYRQAYLQAIGAPHIRIGTVLVSPEPPLWDEDGYVTWVQAPLDRMIADAADLGAGLQQLYHPGAAPPPAFPHPRWEPLSQAQTPAWDWRPDGIDPVSWLLSPYFPA